MVTYDEFVTFSGMDITPSDYPKVERTAVDLLSALCGSKWDITDDVCKDAVLYQVEFIFQAGGLSEWMQSKGAIGSRSYSVGSESESVTYIRSGTMESGKAFNGLQVSPLSWALLTSNGILRQVRGVRVC